MREFTDRQGVRWQLEITAGSGRKRILARLGVDLLEPERDQERLFALLRSTTQLMDLIYCLVEPQVQSLAQSLGTTLTEDDFWDRFDAAELAEAIRAAREELDFFIRSCQPHSVLLQRLGKAAALEELERQKVTEFLASGELDTLLASEVDRLLTQAGEQLRQTLQSVSSPTNWPATSAPTSTA